jgi:hypothetical protein
MRACVWFRVTKENTQKKHTQTMVQQSNRCRLTIAWRFLCAFTLTQVQSKWKVDCASIFIHFIIEAQRLDSLRFFLCSICTECFSKKILRFLTMSVKQTNAASSGCLYLYVVLTVDPGTCTARLLVFLIGVRLLSARLHHHSSRSISILTLFPSH